MPNFRPRISVLSALLLTTIVSMALVIAHLWHEVVPLRADNKRLNEERGTLVLGDRSKLHAIEIPARFAGECLTSFRIYVPPDQKFAARLFVNNIPKTGLPEHENLGHSVGILGGSDGKLCAGLEPGERVVTVKTVEWRGKSDISLELGDFRNNPLEADAQTPKDRWPTIVPDTYTIYGDHEVRESLVANGSEPLVLKRYRIEQAAHETDMHSWVTPEPDYALDGFILWVERIK